MIFTEPVDLCSDCSALLLDFIHSGHQASHAAAGQAIPAPLDGLARLIGSTRLRRS